MAVISLDSSLVARTFTLRRIDAGRSFTSINGATQYEGSTADRWGFDITWRMYGATLSTLMAYLDRLGGRRNSLRVSLQTHLGYAQQGTPGACTLNGAHAAGVSQIAVNVPTALGTGDLFELNNQLIRATNISGGNVDIWPPLHSAGSNLDPIEEVNPTVDLYLIAPPTTALENLDGTQWLSTVTASFEEDVNA